MSSTKIIKTIKRHRSFLISTHVSPDPDALCSELAMALYLKSLGKKVTIINEEPVPDRFLFLPRVKFIKTLPKKKKINYDVAIILDCGDLNRVGEVHQLVDEKKPLINIDHHITNDLFGTIRLIQPKASSTAEMLFDLLQSAKCKMTRDIAILLYLGIMTDTGAFRYDNTTAHTHHVISQLMAFNFPVSALYRRLYERVPFGDIKIFTKVVGELVLLCRGRVVCVQLSKKLLDRFSADFDLREKIFTFLRSIQGVEVLVILTECGRKKTRVNFRSQGEANVAELASFFGGGGHKKASGCMFEDSLFKTKEKVLKRLRKML